MFLTLVACILGLANGVRHAIEPDHLAAVSTVVAQQKSAKDSMRFAATWGFGHGLVLLLVGGILLLLRAHMPHALEEGFEFAVGIMLVILGARAIQQALRSSTDEHRHPIARPRALRALLIGVVHGLAGSGALAALAATRAPSLTTGLVFLALYGAGATLGMASLAGLAGVPIARLLRAKRAGRILLTTAGALSLVMGLGWGMAAAMAMHDQDLAKQALAP